MSRGNIEIQRKQDIAAILHWLYNDYNLDASGQVLWKYNLEGTLELMYTKFWCVQNDMVAQEFDIITLGVIMLVLVNQNRIEGLDIEKLKSEIKYSDIKMNDYIPIKHREIFLLILEIGTQLRSGDLPYLNAINSVLFPEAIEPMERRLICAPILRKLESNLLHDRVNLLHDRVPACSYILKEYALSGYPPIVRLFHTSMSQSRIMGVNFSGSLYWKLSELRNLTISHYKNGMITKEDALALADATQNFIEPLQRIHNPGGFVGYQPVTIDGLIAEFKTSTQQFRSRATFLAILDAVIQAVIGVVAGAAIGFVVGGGIPGAATGALVGGFVGLSSLKFTMWHGQEYGFNKAMAEGTEAVIDAARRVVP